MPHSQSSSTPPNVTNSTRTPSEADLSKDDPMGINKQTPSPVKLDIASNTNNNIKEDSSSSSSSPVSKITPNMEVAGILCINVFSVVGIIAINKKIFQTPGFQFPSTLMSLHFFVTYLFVLLFLKMGYFTPKKIETKQYAKLGAAQVGSVALVNLSLVYNDVGTYQLMKFLVIFVTCFLEYMMFKKIYSWKVYAVLSALVLSVSFATINTLAPSTVGILFGVGGALSTSYYQILNKFVQQEFEVQPLQLLHYEQPWSAGWCLLFALMTEPVHLIFQVQWTQQLVSLIALSAFCAFCVNASVYMIIGKTGPITYSVLGHVKTVSVFAIGVFFLGDKVTLARAFWMTMAFFAIVLYGQVSQGAAATAPTPKEDEEKEKLNGSELKPSSAESSEQK